eukprot:scaffold2339_cov54-Attheya_sp.AAC.4
MKLPTCITLGILLSTSAASALRGNSGDHHTQEGNKQIKKLRRNLFVNNAARGMKQASARELSVNSAKCAIHSKCMDLGLDGACCPANDDIFLDCCDEEITSQCSSHSECDHLDGFCCPTNEGVFLTCCHDGLAASVKEPKAMMVASNDSRQCVANAYCAPVKGDCCPTIDGVYLHCCGAENTFSPTVSPTRSTSPSAAPSRNSSALPSTDNSTIPAPSVDSSESPTSP